MSSNDIEFSRHYLVEVHKDVRRAGVEGNLWKAAWVWNSSNSTYYEFHGPEGFRTSLRASNAYEARAKGWSEYIKEKHPELHKQLEREAEAVDAQGPR